MKSHKIALLGGDGIGPEVVREGKLLLELLREERGLPLELWDLDLGADRFLRDGTTFPAEIRVAIQRECSAVLLGALGDPRVPNMEHARDIIFGMRQGYDLYANVRPCRCLSDRLVPLKGRAASDVDFVVFRENTEGIYVGMGGQFKRGTPDEVAINEDVNTRKGVERIIRAAFEYARAHNHPVVHMADKSNAMRHAHELWLRVFDQVSREYAPAIKGKHVYVDALCLYLINDPSQFKVIVTNNLFGDIVTDLGAALQGGLGMAASANVHGFEPGRVAMFEPVHGSAPDIAGKGIANPFACLLTVGMMMSHLGHPELERVIEGVIARAIDERRCTRDVGGELTTQAASAWARDEIRSALRALHLARRQERVPAQMALSLRTRALLIAAALTAPHAAQAQDKTPFKLTLAPEINLGGSHRLSDAATGRDLAERNAVSYQAGLFLGIGKRADVGLTYLHSGVGFERESDVAGKTGAETRRSIDAGHLEGRFFAFRNDWAAIFISLTAGLAWQNAHHRATLVSQADSSPIFSSARCSATGKASIGLGAGIGGEFSLGGNWSFLGRFGGTSYQLSGDPLDDCVAGSGTANLLQLQFGFLHRFDLTGSPEKKSAR